MKLRIDPHPFVCTFRCELQWKVLMYPLGTSSVSPVDTGVRVQESPGNGDDSGVRHDASMCEVTSRNTINIILYIF